MKNKFYTIMIVPEKTDEIKKFVIPVVFARGIIIASVFAALVAVVMVFDYIHVISKVAENKELRTENREIKQEMQVFRNKLSGIENTLDRVKTFTAKLRIITNLDDKGSSDLELFNPSKNSQNGAYPVSSQPHSQNNANDTYTDNIKTSSHSETIVLPSQQHVEKDLKERFEEVDRYSALTEQDVQDLYELLESQSSFIAARPTRKPSPGWFTSGFGIRFAPIGGKMKMHEGLDIGAKIGTPVIAPADGLVAFSGTKAGYGKLIIVDHGYSVTTAYAHLNRTKVNAGDKVKRGQLIGEVGNTGGATGAHLHYEVRVNGIPMDPKTFVLEE